MKPRLLIATVVVLLVGAGLWVYLKRHSAEAVEAKPTATVELSPLKVEPISETLEVFGVVESSPGTEQVSSAPYDCIIENVLVAAGDKVAAGDVLVQIGPSPDSRLVLEAARSALIVADKSLEATQERYDLRLATNQELAVARQAQADARAKLTSLEARGLGGDGKLKARSSGVVSKLDAATGALVLLGAPLASVANAGRLEARLSVEGSARAKLAKGATVSMTSAEDPGADPVEGEVRSVGAALNAAAGSLDVRVGLPNSAGLLLGEHVKALIEVRKVSDSFVVPRSAVLPDDDAQVLYTARDGKAIRHEITIGIVAGDRLEVHGKDLNAGDLLVITGNYELTDGMAVEVAKPEPKGVATEQAASDADKEP